MVPIFSEYGVSVDLANFLTMSMDMSIKNYTEFMSSYMPPGQFDILLKDMDRMLELKLEEFNMTGPLELMHALAKS